MMSGVPHLVPIRKKKVNLIGDNMDNVKLLRLALSVISDRLLTLCGLVMSFALACWTMEQPTWERLGMSAFFALFSYLLVMAKERKQNEKTE